MLKGIFTKYMVSFMSLLGIGFIAVALIMSSVLTTYLVDSKSTLMYNSAETVYNSVNSLVKTGGLDFASTVRENQSELDFIFSPICKYSDSILIIADKKGNIIEKAGQDSFLIKGNYIGNSIMAKSQSNTETKDHLDGLFEDSRYNYIYPVSDKDKNLQGMIILSSLDNGLGDVFKNTIFVIIVSTLWVFIAAAIAVFFITDRIVTPLKKMSQAADSYSKGIFEVRVDVKGTDEIASLANAFNQMAQSLENLESTRSTFLSNVSHDLRTPMTSIKGFIEGIIDGTIPYEKQNYYLGIVLEEVNRLSRLVNSLLDISRMEAGKLKINKTEFDVCEIARIVLLSFEEKIDSKHLNIEFEADSDSSIVCADKDSIHQIVYNLTDNAIKFTDEEGTLRISVHDSGDKYVVSVYNTGIGIQKDELDYVFDRFYKADTSRGLDKTGTGLGLYIAKTKIEAHGEKITVDSQYGKYCEFAFTLAKAD